MIKHFVTHENSRFRGGGNPEDFAEQDIGRKPANLQGLQGSL
jgi:hypothetical protein